MLIKYPFPFFLISDSLPALTVLACTIDYKTILSISVTQI